MLLDRPDHSGGSTAQQQIKEMPGHAGRLVWKVSKLQLVRKAPLPCCHATVQCLALALRGTPTTAHPQILHLVILQDRSADAITA